MKKTRRRLYVTMEEFTKLQELATNFEHQKMTFNVCAEDEFVDDVATLLDAGRSILLEYSWEVVVVGRVVTRFGYDWTRRRGHHRGHC